MRKNEYTSLDQFTSQYTGEWNPSEGHWLGLDFIWHGNVYRFQTGSMYNSNNTILPDGREAIFGLYKKLVPGKILNENMNCLVNMLKCKMFCNLALLEEFRLPL